MSARIKAKADSLENSLVNVRATNGQDIINFRNGLIDQVLFLAGAVDDAGVAPTKSMEDRVGEIDVAWRALDSRVKALFDRDVAELNTLLQGVPAVVVPGARKPVP